MSQLGLRREVYPCETFIDFFLWNAVVCQVREAKILEGRIEGRSHHMFFVLRSIYVSSEINDWNTGSTVIHCHGGWKVGQD